MSRLFLIGLALLLAGCLSTVTPTDTSGRIQLFSGGAFHGSTEWLLYPDDVLEVTTKKPFAEKGRTAGEHLAPGAFDAALAYIRANPVNQAPPAQGRPVCEDYGSDIVGYSVPGEAVSYGDICPNARIQTLYKGVRTIIERYRGT